MSTFEFAKGFTKPKFNNSDKELPTEIIGAQNKLQALCKLILILKSKETKEFPVNIGHLVEI